MKPFVLASEDQMTAILGEPPDFVRAKVADRMDEGAAAFIARSPLVFVGTVDSAGRIDVSPKGGDPGFVHVADAETLLIPERKGNNLAFGPRNILPTGRIGLIFVVPGQREKLRVNGVASLNNDPVQLDRLSARGKPALLCTEVRVEECFVQCGKAMIRARATQVVAALGGDPTRP